jgi:regulator of protease activity HflC (stomatin/prohibitin superfamily)
VLERLIELLAGAWDSLRPYEVVECYNKGVVLRFGRYHRTLEPGLHWKWPFVEDVVSVLACITTLPLPPQTLTSRDDVGVVVAAVVKYEIAKPEPYATDIWDQRDVLSDVTMGAVRQAVSAIDYKDLIVQPPERVVLEAVRKEVNKYGFRIHAVTFTDLGRVRSLRLIQAGRVD